MVSASLRSAKISHVDVRVMLVEIHCSLVSPGRVLLMTRLSARLSD